MRKQTRSISNLNSQGLNSHIWAGEVGIEIGFAFFSWAIWREPITCALGASMHRAARSAFYDHQR